MRDIGREEEREGGGGGGGGGGGEVPVEIWLMWVLITEMSSCKGPLYKSPPHISALVVGIYEQ